MKSFLKWAGGKQKLLTTILPYLNKPRLIEPFVGSGVVFLNSTQNTVIVNDFNADLINIYQQLLGSSSFTSDAKVLFDTCNTQADYSKLRDEFNTLPTTSVRRALLFLYLNRHCFNGLCRYNNSGKFNVPYGKYKSPYFPKQEMLDFVTKVSSINLTYMTGDFAPVMQLATKDDVVYCDPPYVPLNETASFTAYTSGGFSATQQQLLATLAEQAANRGATVVISNHDTPFTQTLYKNAHTILTFNVQRSISASSESRVTAKELLAIF